MSKKTAMKNRLAEMFSFGIPTPEGENVAVQVVKPGEPSIVLPKPSHTKVKTTSQGLLSKRVKLLNWLNDLGHFIDEKPTVQELLEWVAGRLPATMQHQEFSAAAITYKQISFGDAEVYKFPSKIMAELRVFGELVGDFQIAYRKERTFLEEESAFLAVVASSVGGYLENWQFSEQMKKKSHELAVLNEMSRSLTTLLNLDQIAKIIYDFTAQLMEVVDFFVAYYEEENQTVNFSYLYLNGMPLKPFTRPLGKGLTDFILRNRTPILFSDNVMEQMKNIGVDFIPVGDNKPALSWLGVPILYEQQILGVISVQTTEKAGLYTTNDRDLLLAIARQAAVAIQNAISFQKVQTSEADLEVVAVRNARQYQDTQIALAQADALYKGSSSVIQAKSAQEVLEAIVQFTPVHVFDTAYLILFDEPWDENPPGFIKVVAAWESGDTSHADIIGDTFERHEFQLEGLVNSNQPTYILDVNTDQRISDRVKVLVGKNQGIKSLALFPMVASGQFLGVVMIHSTKSPNISEGEIRQIDSLVGQAATVIQSQILRENLQSQLKEMENLQRVLSGQAWSAYLGGQHRDLWGYEYNRVNVRPLQTEMLIPKGNQESAVSTRNRTKADYITTLEVHGEEIGSLGIPSGSSDSLSEEEQNFLKSVADQVAQALERARLIEQTQKSALELQTVAQVSSTSSTALDPNELLQSVVDLTKNSFNLYHAHIYLLDDTETKLVLTSGAGEIGRQMVDEGWTISIDDVSIVARTAKTRQGLIVNDVHTDPNFVPNILLPKTNSELSVPMIVGQSMLGVFNVQSDRVNAFTEDDLRTYSTLATQTAVALQNARLYAEQTVTVERLRELDHLKTSFLANMSHELRTPLNSILGFTQVILEGIDGPLTDYMVSDLQLIEKNGKHLLNLINEVLDMAKIEAGRMSLTIETVDLRELLEDVLETTSSQAREKSIYLSLEAKPTELLEINGDRMRLRQVMLNLVGNAIKFTDSGGISVKVNTNYETIKIIVSDTGIGIPSDKLESIFEAFSQVDTSTTRKAGGTGLGLPISRRLVEMHGGKLWAESSGIGDGTNMHLVLPIQGKTN